MLGALVCYHAVRGQVNLITKIHEHIHAYMSTTWEDLYASNAVDGNETTSADACRCCAGTNDRPSWWRLDLGRQYLIKTIIFIGRSDQSGQSRGFSIHKGFSNSSGQQLLYTNRNTSGYEFTIPLNPPHIALQHLEVSKGDVFTICELKLEEGDCPDGKFGDFCQQCGNCKTNDICDKASGNCPNGCQPGYMRPLCQHQCPDGKFGDPCLQCGNCKTNDICEKATGNCPNGCQPGYIRPLCQQQCADGKFGDPCQQCGNCKTNDICEKATGNCPNGCQPGYIRPLCQQQCPDGKFGDPCQRCGNCKTNDICEKATGNCPNGCQPGYIRPLCQQQCPDGKFGDPCQRCGNCKTNDFCEKATGNCPNGCQPGYNRPLCQQQCPDGKFGDPCQQCGNCKTNDVCDKATGNCPNGCQPGYNRPLCQQQCPDGEYGDPCQKCGYCKNNDTCDKATGNCSNGCQPGYIGELCDQQCPNGEFGDPCQQCGNCKNNDNCDKATGVCPNGCQPSYIGTLCNQQCPDGEFGDPCKQCGNCKNKDTCDKATGNCTNGCDPGYTGIFCSQQCPDGEFGYPCQQCGNCKNNDVCDRVTGNCPDGCLVGYIELLCDRRCQAGSFGQNCSSICHCLENITCDHISGVCSDGNCATGWTGSDCSAVAEALKTPYEGPPTGPIVGAVVGVLVVLIVVIVVILYRKRKSQQNSSQNQESFSELRADIESDKTAPTKLSQRKPQQNQNNDKDAVAVATDHTYYAFDSKSKKISVYDIWDYIGMAYNNKCEKLHQEFQKLPSGLVHDCNEAKRPENAKKTRYKQMFAYDHSRVILKRDDPSVSTYINACYIDGYKKTKKFIASQGPTESMVGDFWEMVIQENTSVIIMLTNVVEHGMTKCIQYWHISENEELTFGDIRVLTAKIDIFPDYTIRMLDISKAGEPSKRITQFHFTAWPDKDVPDTAWHLVNFWREVNSVVQTITEPVVVHCSAGIGRTGTFIGLDNLHAQAKAEGYIQPFDMIRRLRHQRVNMVQTKYVFLHEAVAEALYIGVKPVKANEFDAVYKLLLESDKSTGISGLEQQYRLIKENPTITDETNEYCYVSPPKEYDAYRPDSMTASSSGKGDDLNMYYVHNYAGNHTFIVAKTSNDDTVETLWKMIERHNIKTVITVHGETGSAEAALNKQSKHDYGKGAMQLIETTREKHFIQKMFTAKQHKSGKESSNIKQFMFLAMKDTNTASVISFLNAIQRWQPSVDESHPILITHENAFEQCGLICLLLREFERVRTKDEVNILATVKHLKDKSSQMIPDYEQYKLCYLAVLEYIRQSDVYMNV